MKRSEINRAYRDAMTCFARHHWALPTQPSWDITDFGLGNFAQWGLALINLAAEAEYCEKLMYARRGQTTPCHTHRKKKEDIICRSGELTLRLWPAKPVSTLGEGVSFSVSVEGKSRAIVAGRRLTLAAGSRVTLVPGVWHEFFPESEECIIGEVSTANDDEGDNFFLNAEVGRFPSIEEDEPPRVSLVSDNRPRI
jgi:D-lyxose ketol-isomerase